MGEGLGDRVDNAIVFKVTKCKGDNKEVTEEEDKVSNAKTGKKVIEDV